MAKTANGTKSGTQETGSPAEEQEKENWNEVTEVVTPLKSNQESTGQVDEDEPEPA
jgi:hypothetical protein